MNQPPLFDLQPVVERGLICALGEPWMGDHPLCRAAVDASCAAFDAAVLRGEYDEAGYTPKERKAYEKRLKALQAMAKEAADG